MFRHFSDKTGTFLVKCMFLKGLPYFTNWSSPPHSCWVHVCQTVEKYSIWKSVRGTLPVKHGVCWTGFVVLSFFVFLYFALTNISQRSFRRLLTSLVSTDPLQCEPNCRRKSWWNIGAPLPLSALCCRLTPRCVKSWRPWWWNGQRSSKRTRSSAWLGPPLSLWRRRASASPRLPHRWVAPDARR